MILLSVLFTLLLSLILLRTRYVNRQTQPTAIPETEISESTTAETATETEVTGVVRRRRGGLARLQRAAIAATSGEHERGHTAGANDDGENGVGYVVGEENVQNTSHIGKRKKKKEAHREAKREAQLAHQAALAAYRERQQAAEEARQAEQALEEAAAEEAEATAKALAKEEARKEQAEYDNWKHLISVEDTGDVAVTDAFDDPALLQRFCDYVKSEKVVVLEDIAAEFDLRTEAVIDRLTKLEESGNLTGFFDDRGKFIYVSMAEMEQVARFIQKRGRISIQELAVECSKILRLDRSVTSS